MVTRVFLSWSGKQSKAVAHALGLGIQGIDKEKRLEPWISEDIAPFEDWRNELKKSISSSNFAVLCVTPANLWSPWMLWEAGALAIELEKTNVSPYLLNIPVDKVPDPLRNFQCIVATKEGTKKLLSRLGDAVKLPDTDFAKRFDKVWPKVRSALEKANTIREDKAIWSNVANLYWTGHDIMWTLAALERDAPVKSIVHGLRQFLHQALCCGIQGCTEITAFEVVETVKSSVETLPEREGKVPIEIKEQVRLALERVRGEIGSLVNNTQVSYSPYPPGNEELWIFHKSIGKT